MILETCGLSQDCFQKHPFDPMLIMPCLITAPESTLFADNITAKDVGKCSIFYLKSCGTTVVQMIHSAAFFK